MSVRRLPRAIAYGDGHDISRAPMTIRSYLGTAALIVFALLAIFTISSGLDVWFSRSVPVASESAPLPTVATRP